MSKAKSSILAAMVARVTVANSSWAQVIVLDQGPTTGAFSQNLGNGTNGQNFADSVRFASTTVVDGYNFFTFGSNSPPPYDTLPADFHLKILSDTGGSPGSVLYATDLGYSSYTPAVASLGGVTVNRLHFSFAPFSFSGGVDYWVGLSGNSGSDPGQLTVYSPQDGKIAMFGGSSLSGVIGFGDQVYQLTSTNTNVPGPLPVLGALAAFGWTRKLRKRIREA